MGIGAITNHTNVKYNEIINEDNITPIFSKTDKYDLFPKKNPYKKFKKLISGLIFNFLVTSYHTSQKSFLTLVMTKMTLYF